jgi:predicted N-acetyltransferase YhbS
MITIASEQPDDAGAIEALLDLTFGAGRLAKASYRYRQGVRPIAELCRVARDGPAANDEIVGAIRYWPVRIGRTGTPALLLGPLAVNPARRGEGIGRTLVAQTLDWAMLAGHKLVVLVGDLDYYRQFGFEPALPHGISMPREKTPERLQVRELAPGSLGGIAGDIRPWRSVRRRRLAGGAGRSSLTVAPAAAEPAPQSRDEAAVVVPLRRR